MPAYTENGLPTSGTTAQRPTNAEIGFRYFDTTLNQPLTFAGSGVWRRGDGSPAFAAPASVAATGSTQADAIANSALSYGLNGVTAADATKGVALPAATPGAVVIVKNLVAANLKIYPQVGSQINAITANSAYTAGASGTVMFFGYNATTWYSLPSTAS